jgi:hypothetical protein
MKCKILSIALSLIFLATLLHVQAFSEEAAPGEPPTEADPTKGEASPSIVFEELEHDFGEIEQQVNVKYVFTFHNKGDSLLVVDQVKPSCGCTGTLLSEKEIPPGGQGEIEVTFKPGLQSGKKKKAIYVYSNDPTSPTTKLYVMVDIVVPVEVRPRQINWMADRNQPSKRIVELLYQPELNINIVRLEISSPAFTATATPKGEGEKPGYDIEVAFDGTLPGNRFSEKLIITTDNPKYPTLRVFIRGSITGKVKIVPNAVALGVVKSEESPSRSIRVYTKDTALDFKITAIEPSSPLISTEVVKDQDANGYRVNVSLTAMPPRGAFAEKLLIRTNVENEPPTEVAVYAFVKEIN